METPITVVMALSAANIPRDAVVLDGHLDHDAALDKVRCGELLPKHPGWTWSSVRTFREHGPKQS